MGVSQKLKAPRTVSKWMPPQPPPHASLTPCAAGPSRSRPPQRDQLEAEWTPVVPTTLQATGQLCLARPPAKHQPLKASHTQLYRWPGLPALPSFLPSSDLTLPSWVALNNSLTQSLSLGYLVCKRKQGQQGQEEEEARLSPAGLQAPAQSHPEPIRWKEERGHRG